MGLKYWAALALLAVGIVLIAAADAAPLDGITVAPEIDGSTYDRRHDFGGWIDADGDGVSTRHEVLAAESLIPPTWDGNKVIAGLWFDPFTGRTFTATKRADGYAHLQIDHVVPLKEAWESGARDWTKAQRVKYANDLDNPGHLIAVHGPTNGSKGKKDPAEWLPPNEGFHCAYVQTWTAIKAKWNLTMDLAEFNAVQRVLEGC